MSETSESYHIRTADPKAAIKKLRSANFAGLVFPPEAGWLTFIPYDTGPSDAERKLKALANTTGNPVLWYLYAEDFGWGVSIGEPQKDAAQFNAHWDGESGRSQPDEFLAALNALELNTEQADAVREIFQTADVADFEAPPAYRFAEIVGLPAYKWISPHYVTVDTDEFLGDGARKIGRKPKQNENRIPAPANRTVNIPDHGLSARDVIEIVDPIMVRFGDEWNLAEVCGSIEMDGRTPEGNWIWWIFYLTTGLDRQIRIELWQDGRLTFEGMGRPEDLPDDPEQPDLVPFPTEWLDTPDIMSSLKADLDAHGVAPPEAVYVSLSHTYETAPPTLFWHASWNINILEPSWTGEDHAYTIDALSGTVLGDEVKYYADGQVVEEKVNVRDR